MVLHDHLVVVVVLEGGKLLNVILNFFGYGIRGTKRFRISGELRLSK